MSGFIVSAVVSFFWLGLPELSLDLVAATVRSEANCVFYSASLLEFLVVRTFSRSVSLSCSALGG